MSIDYDPNVRNGALDEFITPPQLMRLSSISGGHEMSVLDAGCNLGQWGEELKVAFPKSTLVGVEQMIVPRNPAYDADRRTRLSDLNPEVEFDLIIGNSPYSLTIAGKRHTIVNEWIAHSLLATYVIWYVLLLRKGFNHSLRAWRQVLNDNPPYREYMIVPRPNFYGKHDLRTDGSSGAKWDYSLVHFLKGYTGKMTCEPLFWKDI
jgi:hypothetical protein